MKLSTPQGTRDFSAQIIYKRALIFNTIKAVFELYGFEPLETPAVENLETLLGKYGDEGDSLMFKILNNGLNNPAKKDRVIMDFEKILSGKSASGITERALRYDLTIPFARYVAMHHGQLTFPYKRYQIQPVWRADRPQKGRYREFYQCDADVAGSKTLVSDIEMALIYGEVFKRLNVEVEIKINSRKILTALAKICGVENMPDIFIAIDKFDKIGLQNVKEELKQKNLSPEHIALVHKYLTIDGTNEAKLNQAKIIFKNIPEGEKGIEELAYILNYAEAANVQIDFTLARGLNYYTGTIYEVKAKHIEIGSLGGGGRYDDLTGLFGVPGLPGVGISFGVDRIYDVMEELKVFPEEVPPGTKVLFFNMGEEESRFAFKEMQALRSKGISAELYHETAKMDKQFKYATKKNISFAVIIGSQEMKEKHCMVKDLKTGEQTLVDLNNLGNYF